MKLLLALVLAFSFVGTAVTANTAAACPQDPGLPPDPSAC